MNHPHPKRQHRVREESRLAARLRKAGPGNDPALIAYITAGDPTLEFTAQLVLRLAAAGVDAIELGVPFSDPIADGPVIQRASQRALCAGTTLARVLELAARIRRRSDIPLVLFSYYNPVLQLGGDKFAREAAAAGVDGVLITDLTPEEAGSWIELLHREGLDTIFLAAPTSTPARLKAIARSSSGFVYVISRRGVTGPRSDLPEEVRRVVARLRRYTPLPLAVGFGIAHRDQVAALAGIADAAVVGSALVECCERHRHSPEALEAAAALVSELRGLRARRSERAQERV